MTASNVTVTVGTTAVANYLQTACPCGQTWTAYSTRTLFSCNICMSNLITLLNLYIFPTANCPDTTWLGGTPTVGNPNSGYVIGEPFYAGANGPLWGTNGNLVISYIDASSSIGWNNLFPISGQGYVGNGEDICVRVDYFSL